MCIRDRYTYDSVDGTYMRTELGTPTVAQEENDTTMSELVPGIAKMCIRDRDKIKSLFS